MSDQYPYPGTWNAAEAAAGKIRTWQPVERDVTGYAIRLVKYGEPCPVYWLARPGRSYELVPPIRSDERLIFKDQDQTDRIEKRPAKALKKKLEEGWQLEVVTLVEVNPDEDDLLTAQILTGMLRGASQAAQKELEANRE
jgi:hypothetical protein